MRSIMTLILSCYAPERVWAILDCNIAQCSGKVGDVQRYKNTTSVIQGNTLIRVKLAFPQIFVSRLDSMLLLV